MRVSYWIVASEAQPLLIHNLGKLERVDHGFVPRGRASKKAGLQWLYLRKRSGPSSQSTATVFFSTTREGQNPTGSPHDERTRFGSGSFLLSTVQDLKRMTCAVLTTVELYVLCLHS